MKTTRNFSVWGLGLVTLAFMVVNASDYLQAQPPSGEFQADANTVALYHCNEGTGGTVGDVSGNNNHGTIYGATWTSAGRFGYGLSFDGINDYLRIPNSSSFGTLSTQRQFTVDLWIKVRAYPSPGSDMHLVTKWGSGGNEDDAWIVRLLSNGTIELVVNSSTAANSPNTDLPSTTSLPLNTWYWVSCVWNGVTREAAIYFDGSGVAYTNAAVETMPHVGQDIGIGSLYYNPTPAAFNGFIDEVRISNIARTPASTLTGTISGVVKDASTGFPIRWASVSASGGYSDPDGTDSEGRYELLNVPAGSGYTVTASAPSFLPKEATNVSVTAGQATTVSFSIEPEFILKRQLADGSYEYFDVEKHGWRFGQHDGVNYLDEPPDFANAIMWPKDWWDDFDYSKWPYPPLWPYWPINAQSQDFPDWPLFTDAFGKEHCYWDPPPGTITYNFFAIAKWSRVKSKWNGSCFGFAVSSFLAFDDKEKFVRKFSIGDFDNLHDLEFNGDRRKLINLLWIYQHGKIQKAHINKSIRKTPNQTLQEIKQMFADATRDDRVLMLDFQSSRHTVNPYRIVKDQNDPEVEYIYVYDSNLPSEPRIVVNASQKTWKYPAMKNVKGEMWGGSDGLFLMDPVSNYFNQPVLPILPKQIASEERWLSNEATDTNYIEFYNTFHAEILIAHQNGNTIGYSDSIAFNNFDDGIPIIPVTGNFHPPIGYFVPNGQYTIRMQNFADSSAYFSVFTDSLVYNYARRDALASQTDNLTYGDRLTIRNQDLQSKKAQLEAIIVEPDNEKVFRIEDYTFAQNDSLSFHVANPHDLSVLNFGSNKSYDLSLELASANGEMIFAHSGIELSPNTSHLISPDWQNLGQQTVPILIDQGMNGTIDDTLMVENFAVMNYNFAQAGWQMISLPVTPADSLVSVLLPSAIGSMAYGWNASAGNYETTSKMQAQRGYWIAIPQATAQAISGLPVESYTTHFSTPGWYMIGSVSQTIDFTNPQDDPDGAILATFGWEAATQSYSPTTNLERGKGYWIAVAQACELTIGGSGANSVAKATHAMSWQAFASQFGSMPPLPPSSVINDQLVVNRPTDYGLSQSYPNPFNPETFIEYQLPEPSHVSLKIYDLMGREVRTLVNDERAAGYHRVTWDGRDEAGLKLHSGIYLYRMQAGDFVQARKILLVK